MISSELGTLLDLNLNANFLCCLPVGSLRGRPVSSALAGDCALMEVQSAMLTAQVWLGEALLRSHLSRGILLLLGARICSNNTAELTGIAEEIWWVVGIVFRRELVKVLWDSKHVPGWLWA